MRVRISRSSSLPVFRNHNCNGLTDRLFSGEAEDTSAPLFQLVIMPSRFLLTIASSLDSTMDARQRNRCSLSRSSASIACVGNVAIDLKHRAVAEQLHPAVYDDFAAILAEM